MLAQSLGFTPQTAPHLFFPSFHRSSLFFGIGNVSGKTSRKTSLKVTSGEHCFGEFIAKQEVKLVFTLSIIISIVD